MTMSLSLMLEEQDGIARHHEPITVGVPFPRGLIQQLSECRLFDPQGRVIPLQTEALACWPDQSVKWGLLDFQADVAAHTRAEYALVIHCDLMPEPLVPIQIEQTSDSFRVDTGAAIFTIPTRRFAPFSSVMIDGQERLDAANSCVSFEDDAGRQYEHHIEQARIETSGALRTTLKLDGQIRLPDSDANFARFAARLHFYAHSAACRIDYTIHNPNAAQHPGGLWDLGDPGSIYFNDLSFHVVLLALDATRIRWATQMGQPLNDADADLIEIYQDSSGGEHWQSSNHVNRFGKVMCRFRGYQVTSGQTLIEEGHRASPLMTISNCETEVTGSVVHFWQNFPKAIQATGNLLTLRLFPAQYADVFELQGGERKTHTLFLCFESSVHQQEGRALDWIHAPLLPRIPPEWYAGVGVFPYLTPYETDPHQEVIALIAHAIEGGNSFVDRREFIDEYGWRNFGELVADHEQAYYKHGGTPVSHYNNQYDGIYAHLLQFARSGNPAWFRGADELARHVRDIDIYHTELDKPAYNGGLFWHTFHYVDAGTATHRAYSKQVMEQEGFDQYGGGHSNEHCYATGFMYHYYMTGDPASKEVAVGLTDWVMNIDDGAQTPYKFLNTRPTGLASCSNSPDYHGPGRGGGYAINTLLDGLLLTNERPYLTKAEELIRRCIHPRDDIDALNLLDAENRWSYVVFLQVLGRYLDLKTERQETDEMFCYARESLLHYAAWMRAHERCISTVFETVNYPTETWPAQDLRKNNIFLFAAKYAEEPLRSEFLQKADYFFKKPFEDLCTFETRTFTRPLILVMTNTLMPSYFFHHPDEKGPDVICQQDFGQPKRFRPQLRELQTLREWVRHSVGVVRKILGKEWKKPIK